MPRLGKTRGVRGRYVTSGFIDIFRSPDLSGGASDLWFLFELLIPLTGVVVYRSRTIIAAGEGMHLFAPRPAACRAGPRYVGKC
jgi:hypothetical protein